MQTFKLNEMPPEQPSDGSHGRRVTEEDLTQWREWRTQGISVAEIARRAGRQQAFVYQKLKKAGITGPPKAERPKGEAGATGRGITPRGTSKTAVASSLPQPLQPLNPGATKPRNLAELLGRRKVEATATPQPAVTSVVTPSQPLPIIQQENPNVQVPCDEGDQVGSSPSPESV